MVAEASTEPDWEYAPLRIAADVSRVAAAVQLSLHAEFGGWELARVLRFEDGTRRVELPPPPPIDLGRTAAARPAFLGL
jgi:hypothetical protein